MVDAANVLPDDRETALEAKLATLEQQTGRQFVVATIADMQGYPLDDYGYQLGRNWGIGQEGQNNGVVLFIAPNNPAGQRGPRIEVGYGLEPVLTDALSSVIINTQMMPRLKDGDIPGAMEAGADAIIEQLRLPAEEARARSQQIVAQAEQEEDGGGWIIMIFWIIVLLFVVIPMFFGGRRGKRYRRGRGPVVIWGPGLGGGGWGSGGGGWGGGSSGGGGFGGFSGGGGSFGGGGASGGW